jgi:hypothetical protein
MIARLRRRRAPGVVTLCALWCLGAPSARADGPTGDTDPIAVPPHAGELLEEPPQYGMYYQRLEPSFYTGFAPRTLDSRGIHLHVGRGTQLRVTVVLSDALLEEYARDLWLRYRTYRTLIDSGQVVPTQNMAFEQLEATIRRIGLGHLVADEATMSPADVRARNLALLEQLNPGRVFRIRMPADEVLRRWLARLRPADRASMNKARQLDLLNLMLPTRLWIAELDPAVSKQLEALVRVAPSPDQPSTAPTLAAVRRQFFALLGNVSAGMYPLHDDTVAFDEFTAIYPVASVNEFTDYRGRKIPLYPTPGRRALTTHQRTKTADHIPDKGAYGYFPWIPYMHVGTTMHNSFHTLWWRMKPEETSFLPASWRRNQTDSRDGESYQYLWLLSRGPMSHGCTHVNAGHISELRQMLPAPTERLYEVDTFLNKSYHYDVFDIDGDFQPEVMGVRYFIAYSLRDKKPNRLRVRNERRTYYDWLYGGDLAFDAADRGVFRDVSDGHFVGRTAVEGAHYDRIALYEAEYQPHRIQFYRMVDIPFARRLRQVGLHHPFPGIPGATIAATGTPAETGGTGSH